MEMEPELPLARFRLRFRSDRPPPKTHFLGSAWRGILGRALRKTVCITLLPNCLRCPLLRSCAYPYVFETPPPPDTEKMRKYTAAPHPFVLQVPWGRANVTSSEETDYDLGLTLIGRGADYLPYLVIAFKTAGEYGVGPGRMRMHLESVKQADPPESDHWIEVFNPGEPLQPRPARLLKTTKPPSDVRLRFVTPMRLVRQGRLVAPDEFRFADLFSSLLRRISLLSYFHTQKPLAVDFAQLTAESREVSLTKARLSWTDWARYSSRQQTNIRMGGIMGEVTCSLEGAESLWPYVWLGRWIHAGKGTSMGLGCYMVDSASLS